MRKKILAYLLVLTVLIMPLSIVAAPTSGLKVTLNGKVIATKVTQLADNTRYLPIKDLLVPMGYNVSYDTKAKALVAMKTGSKLVFPVNQKYILKNGIKITIPKAIKSYNSQTCISTDSLTPSLNATCIYFPNQKMIEINLFARLIDTVLADIPPLTMPEAQLTTYKKAMASKINYVIDERLFTLMAYANYLGYNIDNGGGFSTTRKNVIQDLKAKNLKLTVNPENLIAQLKKPTLGALVRDLGSAPNFEVLGESNEFIETLSLALKEFYVAADIHTLFLKYKKDYESAITDWQQTDVLDAICKTLYFLKIKPADAPSMTVLVNLTDANLNGLGLAYDEALKTNTIIMGPGKGNAVKVVIVHEYLHGIIGPILKKYSTEVEKLNSLSQLGNDKLIQSHYNNWASVVEESVVRSLDFLAFTFPRHYQLGLAKQQGFILIDYFFNRFATYSKSSMNLDAFIYQSLVNYKA